MTSFKGIRVVPKIMGPLWVDIILWHLLFGGYQKGTLILRTTHIDYSGGVGFGVREF